MKTKNGILEMENIVILDATPAFADVISGAVPRPEPFQPSPAETPWQKRRSWWHYAVKTPAGKRALEHIGCTVDTDKPWWGSSDGWRIQPWKDPGEADTHPQFANAVQRLREAVGDPGAGVFFAEICLLDTATCNYVRSHQTMIALNVDGTRAAVVS